MPEGVNAVFTPRYFNAMPSHALRTDLRHPMQFWHVASAKAMPEPALAAPMVDAYAVHVQHRPIGKVDIWHQGKHVDSPVVGDGGCVIFDLRCESMAHIQTSFEFSRFLLPRQALDDLTYEKGLRRIELRADLFETDLVIKHLALALASHVCSPAAGGDALVADAVAMALFNHVAVTYGGSPASVIRIGALLPWQLRRITDWVEASMHKSISIADLASLLNLSPSHFARSFSKAQGMAPHRWVLQMRVERAKQLLKCTDLALIEVATSCGFVDQSHFTNVFTRTAGCSPGRWRRRFA